MWFCLMTKSPLGMMGGGRRGRQRRERQLKPIRDLVNSESIIDKRIGTIRKQIESKSSNNC